MGYRDDFYTVENIIGHSGVLESFPTVYFRAGDEYGHITQKHDASQNTGRHAVKTDSTYIIGNYKIEGEVRLIEASGGKIFHVSRSVFVKMSSLSKSQQDVLAQAIWRCPNEKYISSFSKDIFKAIDKTTANMAKVHEELLKGPFVLRHVPPDQIKGSGA